MRVILLNNHNVSSFVFSWWIVQNNRNTCCCMLSYAGIIILHRRLAIINRACKQDWANSQVMLWQLLLGANGFDFQSAVSACQITAKFAVAIALCAYCRIWVQYQGPLQSPDWLASSHQPHAWSQWAQLSCLSWVILRWFRRWWRRLRQYMFPVTAMTAMMWCTCWEAFRSVQQALTCKDDASIFCDLSSSWTMGYVMGKVCLLKIVCSEHS